MKGRLGQFNLSKLLILSVIINIIQISLIFVLILYRNNINLYNPGYLIVYIVAITIAANTLITGVCYYKLLYKNGEKNIIETFKYLEDFNKKLREQRHDYLNHIQVIYTLMELEDYKEAREYIEPVYRDIIRVSKALKTSKPAVNALLQAKMQMAEENNIMMELEIKTNLDTLCMEPWEFCKVLGNIIDNSIYALKEDKFKNNPTIFIEFGESFDNLIFKIMNNGPKIPKENIERIFEQGFSTKGNNGDGMGLTIVKDLIHKYRGEIYVDSSDDRTSFDIKIPKKQM
ncbi:sensor histidine kinase [Clostridium fallax]|uniref:histidine kinase n=1 Tax=Clostridium fallax TaxID=1533 RepID=A0A1M4T834_9CLOT|nr:Spo0B domain-containing protein [Clostridium fallax]SHE40656.1 Histidine kinase-, DNA gyrase B-, and HSP90-like ATPase [Clostridium fallax]SQB22644.1 signal transduction histidine kinase regulating citrate/malate metabolism [Clostridium fallax]